jgi:hypothetical protein
MRCTEDDPDAIMLSVKSVLTSDPELPGSVRYSFDIDVGEFDLGHRLIARSITLWNDRLFFQYAFVPGITPEEWEDRSVFLNAHYDADVSPPDWNSVGTFGPFEGGPSTEGDDQYARPPREARYVWFDFFLIDFDYMVHHGPDGRGDEDYVRNRVRRLTLDLATGDARTEK